MTTTSTTTPTAGVSLTTLPSGVRVVSERLAAVRSLSIGFWVAVGSRDEDDDVAGASHFLEHLLFKGTTRRSARQIAEEIEAVGGDSNAFTSKEYTCFWVRCLGRDLDTAVDVLADMITSATITPDDVDSERSVVVEEIRMHLDTPDDLVHSDFATARYGRHALGREVLGDEDTIEAMPRSHVHGYWAGTYTPSSLVVAAAGDVDHDRLVALVSDALEGWSPTPTRLRPRAAPTEVTAPSVVLRSKGTEQAHVLLGGTGLARGDETRYAAYVMHQALGGGMASRLFQEIREERGLAYSVYSYQQMHADAGAYGVYVGTAPANVDVVLDVVRAELLRLRDGGLGDAELARAKAALAGSIVIGLEDTSSRMTRLGRALTTDTPLLSLDETLAAVEAVTHDDVRRMAVRQLSGPFALAVVGPFDDDARFAPAATPLAA